MEWYYANDRREQVPFREEDLPRLVVNGYVQPDTLVWHEGLPQWTACREIRPDLFSHLPAPLPALPIPPSLPVGAPPQPLHQAQPAYQPPVVAYVPADSLAVASLILGIFGLVSMCCYWIGFPFSIAAIICGHMAKRRLSDPIQSNNRSMALIGLITGYVGFGIVMIFIAILLLSAIADGAKP